VSDLAGVHRLNKASKMTLRANSTLIVDGDRRILVDSGCFSSLDEIDTALRAVTEFGLGEITDCYFTHLHFDHYKPLSPSSPGCKVRIPRREHEFIAELMRFKDEPDRYRQFLLDTHELIAPVFLREFLRLAQDARYQFAGTEAILQDEGEWLSPHVRTVGLAGHCPGQLGLQVETAQGICLVAGDAVISLDDFLAKDISHHLIVFNREQLLCSRQRVAEADYVVPGHGDWFEPKRRATFESSGANP
jgi:glyoxylase-like metal-dependent hydrolase (beta-lactamase superfamily II)